MKRWLNFGSSCLIPTCNFPPLFLTPPFYPSSLTFSINFSNFSAFIRFYLLLFAFMRFYALLWAFIRFYALLSAFMRFYLLLSAFMRFYYPPPFILLLHHDCTNSLPEFVPIFVYAVDWSARMQSWTLPHLPPVWALSFSAAVAAARRAALRWPAVPSNFVFFRIVRLRHRYP